MPIASTTAAAALALAAAASIAGVGLVDPFGTNQLRTQADGRPISSVGETEATEDASPGIAST